MKIFIAALLILSTTYKSIGASAAIFYLNIPTGQALRRGDELISSNGKYSLTLQPGDGNLVVYRRYDMKPLWASHAFGGQVAVVQSDGNFVVFADGVNMDGAIWHTHTYTPNIGNVQLTLTDTGGLKLTNNGTVTWSTLGEKACDGAGYTLYPLCINLYGSRYFTSWPGCSWDEAADNARQEYPSATVSSGDCR
ncbi:MAG: hypothetical protein K0Q78_2258 [Cellvibrio sp.]|nr:hypothetical protein [Cellvibrio sp.]